MADRTKSPQGITFEWVYVTPEKARELLDASARTGLVNRPLNRINLNNLVQDMKTDNFITTPTPVMFNKKGGIIDGQHRLNAIVLSGVALWLRAAWNVPDRVHEVTDIGRRRSLADAEYVTLGGQVRPAILAIRIAISNAMRRGMRAGQRSVSDREKKAFYDLHIEAIAWAVEVAGGSVTETKAHGMRIPSNTLAVVVRAYYTWDRERLERFIALLRSPIVAPGEAAVILLRDHILQNPGSSNAAQHACYRLTEAALIAYLQHREPKRLRPTDQELFPLPEEGRALSNAAD